jgi:hypothetical protein
MVLVERLHRRGGRYVAARTIGDCDMTSRSLCEGCFKRRWAKVICGRGYCEECLKTKKDPTARPAPRHTRRLPVAKFVPIALVVVVALLVASCNVAPSADAKRRPAPLLIMTTSLPPAKTGQPYSQQLIALGGVSPYTWSVKSGSLPSGITLSLPGVLSGTPSMIGNFSFVVEVQDSLGKSHAVQIFSGG